MKVAVTPEAEKAATAAKDGLSVPPTVPVMRPPSMWRRGGRGGGGGLCLWPLAFAALLAAAAVWLPEAEAAKGVRRVRRKKVTTPNLAPKEEVHDAAGVPSPELGGKGESAKQRNPEDGRG